MLGIDELKLLYDTKLKDNLQSLESKRMSLMRRYLISIFIIVASGASCFIASGIDLSVLFILGIGGLIAGVVLLILSSKKKREYRAEYKDKVVKEIVNLMDDTWKYNPDDRISPEEYYSSKIFTKRYDRYKGDDLITGQLDKTDFRCSELHSEYKTVTTDKDGNRKEQWHTIFKGLFFHADFNKEIKGETFVLPDTAEKLLGKFGQKFQKMSSKGELVKLENQEFEKEFVVYGQDQIEPRYILTPLMMEAMVNLKSRYRKNNMYFSFIGSRVFCAITFSKDLFEPRIFSNGVKFSDVSFMADLLSLIEVIIKELNLNTRIWTKE